MGTERNEERISYSLNDRQCDLFIHSFIENKHFPFWSTSKNHKKRGRFKIVNINNFSKNWGNEISIERRMRWRRYCGVWTESTESREYTVHIVAKKNQKKRLRRDILHEIQPSNSTFKFIRHSRENKKRENEIFNKGMVQQRVRSDEGTKRHTNSVIHVQCREEESRPPPQQIEMAQCGALNRIYIRISISNSVRVSSVQWELNIIWEIGKEPVRNLNCISTDRGSGIICNLADSE